MQIWIGWNEDMQKRRAIGGVEGDKEGEGVKES